MNLFEDGLKETLETTRLPCNVSKINDCMKKLDPTYRLDETGVMRLWLWYSTTEICEAKLVCLEIPGAPC